ncbi:MAG: hypothetical protein ACI8QC_001758 [Planctomycetota bacterium]|jgi:hypothetical protein
MMEPVQLPSSVWVIVCLVVSCSTIQEVPIAGDPYQESISGTDPGALLEEGKQRRAQGDHAWAQRAFELAATAAAQQQKTGIMVEALAEAAAGRARAGQMEEAEKFLRTAEAKAVPEDVRAWVRVRATRGLLLHFAHNAEGVAWAYGEAFETAEASAQIDAALECAHRLALWAPEAEREAWAQEGLALAQAYGEQRWAALLWGDLALIEERRNNTAEALQYHLQARRLRYKLGDDRERLLADWAVGRAQRLDGRPQAALEWMTNVLGRAELRSEALEDRDSVFWEALSNRELATIEIALGHEDQAVLYAERAAALFKDLEGSTVLSLDPRDWLQSLASMAKIW